MTPVLVTRQGPVGRIVLNRPEKMNAVNQAAREALAAALTWLEDDDEVRVLVIEGAGDRAFCAGADLAEVGTREPFNRRRAAALEPAAQIYRCTKPVIAKIQGYALGGGAELACACDLRVGDDSAVIGFPEIKNGWIPYGGGGTQLLPRIVGPGAAFELIATGEPVGGREAKAIGLLDHYVSANELEAFVQTLAGRLAQRRTEMLVLAKAAIKMRDLPNIAAGMQYELDLGIMTNFINQPRFASAGWKGAADTGSADEDRVAEGGK